MSSNLTAAELTDMRAALAELMPDTCNILSVANTADGFGGVLQTWGTIAAGTAVACRIDAIRANEQVTGGAIRPYQGWMLTLPWATTISEGYRVEHGGITYAVITIDPDKSWKACVRCRVERV